MGRRGKKRSQLGSQETIVKSVRKNEEKHLKNQSNRYSWPEIIGKENKVVPVHVGE
jgi:hypothetical protein